MALKPPCDEGAVRSSEASAPCALASGPWILAATILGSAMAFIDGTVVNVALPEIQARLGATAVDAQWIVEILTEAGADLDVHWRDTGHGLTYEEVAEAKEWLSRALAKLS